MHTMLLPCRVTNTGSHTPIPLEQLMVQIWLDGPVNGPQKLQAAPVDPLFYILCKEATPAFGKPGCCVLSAVVAVVWRLKLCLR